MNFKEIAAYSLGLFGFQAIVGLLNSYQAEFDASILGADIAVVGILVLVAKIRRQHDRPLEEQKRQVQIDDCKVDPAPARHVRGCVHRRAVQDEQSGNLHMDLRDLSPV